MVEGPGSKKTHSDLPPCGIYIDKEGTWYYKGLEMVHREFVLLFYHNLEMDPGGDYVINWQGSRCYVEVEDTPFVVRRASYQGNVAGPERFVLHLSDDTEETLEPDTLSVGREHVLYCRVKGRSFTARFSRPAYYAIARHVGEEDGRFYLPLNGLKHPIPGLPESES
jgi:uncharacterized protein